MVTTAAAQLANNVHLKHTTVLSPQLLNSVITSNVRLVRVVGQTWAPIMFPMTACRVQLVHFRTSTMKVNVKRIKIVQSVKVKRRTGRLAPIPCAPLAKDRHSVLPLTRQPVKTILSSTAMPAKNSLQPRQPRSMASVLVVPLVTFNHPPTRRTHALHILSSTAMPVKNCLQPRRPRSMASVLAVLLVTFNHPPTRQMHALHILSSTAMPVKNCLQPRRPRSMVSVLAVVRVTFNHPPTRQMHAPRILSSTVMPGKN